MLSISYHGDAGLTLIYKNLNTATSLDTSFIKPTYTHYVPFYSGGTYTIVAGNTITQGASTDAAY